MSPVALTNTVLIHAPADAVFAYLADLRHLPAWNYAIASTDPVGPGAPGVGSVYRQRRTLPRPMEERVEILDHVPGRLLRFGGGLGVFGGRSTYRLREVDGATELTNVIELDASGPGSLVTRLASRGIGHAVHQNLTVLRDILEAA